MRVLPFTLHCFNRCRGGTLFGHQAVVGLASKMLFELMSSQFLLEAGPGVWPAGGMAGGTISERSKRDIVTLLLPDIDCDIMEKLLGLLYSGHIIINNTEAASKVIIIGSWRKYKIAYNVIVS